MPLSPEKLDVKPQRNEALEIVAAIFGGPIAKGTKAGRAQFSVVESEQRHTHRGVNDLGSHAVCDPGPLIDRAGSHTLLGAESKPRLLCSGNSADGTPAPKKPAIAIGEMFLQTKTRPRARSGL